MRTINRFLNTIKNSSPTLLCLVASVGVVATAVLTAKETPKAAKLKAEAKKQMMTKTETIKHVAPAYLPAIATGAGTVACILFSNGISKRKIAILAGAFAAFERNHDEYVEKIKELLGEDAVAEIEKEISKDKLKEVEDEIDEENELPLFYDKYGKRYFNRKMEDVISAFYNTNRNFILRGYAPLQELFKFLDLEEIDIGETLGWSQTIGETDYGYTWIDFRLEKIVTDDGLEYYMIEYPFEPHSDYMS